MLKTAVGGAIPTVAPDPAELPTKIGADIAAVPPVPSRGARAAAAVLIAAYAIVLMLYEQQTPHTRGSDFDQVYFAATALRHGLNPYAVIGPAGPWFRFDYPLYYPMPAVLLAWPLSFLPVALARCAFLGGSTTLLAYGLTRRAWFPLLCFTSMSFVTAAELCQWGPLFAASLVYPLAAVVFPCKPNIGVICGAALPWDRGNAWDRRRLLVTLIGAWSLVLALSFWALPTWVGDWLGAIRHAPHIRPLASLPGGILLVLGLLRWRRPEGRLLTAYGLVPHTTMMYDSIPVMMLGRTRREALALSWCSALAILAQWLGTDAGALDGGVTANYRRLGIACVWGIYLPALAMVLRRPNVGRVPARVEVLVQRLPRWLRWLRGQPCPPVAPHASGTPGD